jgi:predicted nucleotidyltransferase
MDDLASLQEEIQALRAAVQTLQSALAQSHRVTLRPVQPQPYLGQPVTIVLAVTDQAGLMPRVHLPVTLVTTFGRLRPAGAYEVAGGGSLSARTGLDGTFRVALLPPTGEDLLETQQAALLAALADLDPAAPTPRDVQTGLEQMARAYRLEVNRDLRDAVDVYFRDFGHRLLDAVNAGDRMLSWSYTHVTIIAYASDAAGPEGHPLPREGGDGTFNDAGRPTQGSAALTLSFKDWLPPWLQTYQSVAQAESTLAEDLRRATETTGGDSAKFVEGMYGRVRNYVGRQWGLAGKDLSRAAADAALGDFIESGLEKLPLDARLTAFPALRTTGQAVEQIGPSAVATAAQAQTALRQELGATAGQLNSSFREALAGKVDTGAFQAAMATAVQAGTFEEFRLQLDGVLKAKLDATVFGQFQSQLDDTLKAKVDATAFGQFQSQLDDALKAKVDATAFGQFRSQLDGTLKAKVDATAFGQFQDQLSETLKAKVDASTLEQFQGQLTEALKGKVDTATFREAMASAVDSRTFEQYQVTLKDMLSRKLEVATFDEAMATKVDTTTFNTALSSKVDTTTFSNTLAGKADTDALKQLSEQLGNALSDKVGVDAFKAAMDTVVGARSFEDFRAQLTETLKDKVGTTVFDQALATKVDTTALDARLATKADSSTLTQLQTDMARALSTKADLTEVNRISSTLQSQFDGINRRVIDLGRVVSPLHPVSGPDTGPVGDQPPPESGGEEPSGSAEPESGGEEPSGSEPGSL